MTTILILLILALAVYAARRKSATGDLAGRVDQLERRVADLQSVVDALRPERPPAQAAPPREAAAAAPPPPRPTPPPPPPRARSFDWSPPRVSTADLLGAKALAFAGGIVTLLGVVFFFVLAVNRGWIGPELRVGAGAVASALVFACGMWLQRRYETTYSALAAVGVGIAGAYATLLAAASLYDLVSKPVALIVAAAIAALGVAVSLRWSAEVVAAFGLIGAMAVPATLVFQGGLRELGTAFVAVVFAAAAIVAVRQRWWKLLQAAALVSAPQALVQAAGADAPHATVVALASTFWLLYLAAGLAFQFRVGRALAAAPASLLTAGAAFAGICAALLWGDVAAGVAMLVAATAYVGLAAVLFTRAREVAALLGALGLALAAVGLAQALSGSSLTYAWAAEAAVLAWLGSRVRDTRLQIPAGVYLALAGMHALAVDAPPGNLFEPLRHPATGAPAIVAVAVAAWIFGAVKRSWDDAPSRGVLRILDPLLAHLRTHAHRLDTAAAAVSALAVAYAGSLAILELAQAVSGDDTIRSAFDWGHVAVTATWSGACVVGVGFAVRARSHIAPTLSALVAVIFKVLAFDVLTLPETQRGTSLTIVGVAALLAGLARQLRVRALTADGVSALATSLALAVGGALVLWPSGYALVAVGGAYVALAAAVFARRDLSAVLWALGLATCAVGAAMVLDGAWLVLADTATAAALAAISVVLRERRLQVAALAYLALGGLWAVIAEAPPTDLVIARIDPGHGVPSLALVVAATLTLAWALGWSPRRRVQALWGAGAAAIYAASLAILEATQRLSPGGVHTDFQRGHTIVSAFWGILALVSLYAGLQRRRGVLRGGGFVLFAISLGKIFLFDLPSLSSVQRALSFLAVGGVLLLGGFFYQRLNAQYEEPLT